jgi:hypothetical protein
MPASIRFLAINTVDPDQITPFCALLGVEVESTVGDGQLVLFSRTRNGLTVGSQRVLEPKTPGTGCTSTLLSRISTR